MGLEIERKFLVKGKDYQLSSRKQSIIQGYIYIDDDSIVRVRILDGRAFLTVKKKISGLARHEYEFEIDLSQAREMMENLCYKPLIEKIRYNFTFKGSHWEVDEFLGENEDLVIAEIEIPVEGTVIDFPPWIGQEVTHDPKYFNSSLVRDPYKSWK